LTGEAGGESELPLPLLTPPSETVREEGSRHGKQAKNSVDFEPLI